MNDDHLITQMRWTQGKEEECLKESREIIAVAQRGDDQALTELGRWYSG